MSTAELRANAEVVSDRPDRWWHPSPTGKRILIACAVLALLLLLAAGGLAYATYDYSQKYEGKILPGSSVAGVEVGGMTPDQALDAVQDAIRPQLTRKVAFTWKGEKWRTTPAKLGARSNARAAVGAAYAASRSTSFLDRAQMKVFGDEMEFDKRVAITHPRNGVKRFVAGITKAVELEPRDAAIDYSTGWVNITPDRVGYDVNEDEARAAFMKSLRRDDNGARLALPVKTLEPEVTTSSFDQVLLLRIGENRLYLYENGEITHEWTVATGQPEYPTPTGIWEVTEKRYMPTWINPDPTGWGASMPTSIPPGPGNPLGLRAINWSAPAIRFHGTEATYSLGYNASHGCVRMSNSDVIQLYDIIDVGTPIVSTQVASMKPLYATSAPTDDPTVVADTSGDGDEAAGDSGGDAGGDSGGDDGGDAGGGNG